MAKLTAKKVVATKSAKPSIGEIACKAIKAGKTNQQALKEVKKAHPQAKTQLNSIAVYRSWARATNSRTPTNRQAAIKQGLVLDTPKRKLAKRTKKAAPKRTKKVTTGGQNIKELAAKRRANRAAKKTAHKGKAKKATKKTTPKRSPKKLIKKS